MSRVLDCPVSHAGALQAGGASLQRQSSEEVSGWNLHRHEACSVLGLHKEEHALLALVAAGLQGVPHIGRSGSQPDAVPPLSGLPRDRKRNCDRYQTDLDLSPDNVDHPHPRLPDRQHCANAEAKPLSNATVGTSVKLPLSPELRTCCRPVLPPGPFLALQHGEIDERLRVEPLEQPRTDGVSDTPFDRVLWLITIRLHIGHHKECVLTCNIGAREADTDVDGLRKTAPIDDLFDLGGRMLRLGRPLEIWTAPQLPCHERHDSDGGTGPCGNPCSGASAVIPDTFRGQPEQAEDQGARQDAATGTRFPPRSRICITGLCRQGFPLVGSGACRSGSGRGAQISGRQRQ